MKQVTKNKNRGLDFEAIFQRQATKEGFLVIKNHTAGKWVPFPYRHFKLIKGELDFKMIDRRGKVAYLDCKTFNSTRFTFSQLCENQVSRAVIYNSWNIAAGFIVYFMHLDRVVFFSGFCIKRKGPRSSFSIEDGVDLGDLIGFKAAGVYGAAILSPAIPAPPQE